MANLGNPKNTIEIIQKYEFMFQKKFGQNFLIDTHVLEKIITSAGVTKEDCVLEIGPGIGTMTQYLAENARQVVAVEIDKNLIPILGETLAEYDNVTIINEDILKVDIKAIADQYNDGRPIKVVANLPYYITTPIIMGLFESGVPIDNITVMVQKEAADRLCAPMPSKESGAVTAAVRFYAEPKILFKVSRGSFMPAPNVDSAVIRLDIKETPLLSGAAKEMFFAVVKGAFSMRRKTLLNTLSGSLGLSKDQTAACLAAAGIKPSARAEELSLEEFAALSLKILEEKTERTVQ